jgi:hypothetical protein
LVTLTTHAKNQEEQPCLSNRYTNWEDFRHLVNEKVTPKVSLKTEENIEAVKLFDTIQWAYWNSTPEHTDVLTTLDCPIQIKLKNEEKRRLRKAWRRFRTPESKRLLNTATLELKQLLNTKKNDSIQTFLQGLTATDSTDYSLWKVTKKIKQITQSSPPLTTPQGTWARKRAEKAHAFAKHLAQVFQPHLLENTPEEEEEEKDIIQLLGTPSQLELPIKRLKKVKFKKSSRT